jgi:UPF0755 protein
VVKKLVRIIGFIVTIAALVVAAYRVLWFLTDAPSAGGIVPGSVRELFSPGDLLIGAYLDLNAAELGRAAGDDDSPVSFVVEPGEAGGEIAIKLEQAGLVSNAELFRRYVQYHGLDAGMEAGEFTLRQTMTIPQISQALQSGQRPEVTVTVREGLRLEQVAATVEDQAGIVQEEFLALASTGWRDEDLGFVFLASIPSGATLEGFLFPDTYRLPEAASALDLLIRMLETFDTRVDRGVTASAANLGLDLYELVTLASIVEREAVLSDERPVIAGVYHNRLEAGWLLNADPTVQYAIAGLNGGEDWWPVLTLNDLDVNSPYNSYRNVGLPPGPICSPGLASIQAVAYRAETDYFFFLADCTANDGSHFFSATQAEHNAYYQRCGGGGQ